MMDNRPQMEWNIGGWLGGQLGGTAWICVAGLLALPQDTLVASLVLGVFLLANAVGFALWKNRTRISAYRAMQILLLVVGGLGMVAVFALDRDGVWQAIQSGPAVSSATMYLLLPVATAMLLMMFHIQFGRQPRR